MKIPVALELKLPGHIGAFHASEPFADMEYLGRTLRFAAPVSVDAEYVFDGSGFSVKGTLKTSLHSQCARCAKEFEEPFETKFDERFEKNADEDGECYGFSGEELDVSQMLRDAILLNMQPLQRVQAGLPRAMPRLRVRFEHSAVRLRAGSSRGRTSFALRRAQDAVERR